MSAGLLQQELRSRARHLSAFFVLGDPTPRISLDVMLAAVDAGATMLELGLPYNAPCADGPAIQAASRRALAAGTTTDVALELVAILRDARPELPLNLLVYANLVHSRGPREFCRDFATAGASSLLVPDVLLEEGEELRAICLDHGLDSVQLVGPRTPTPRLAAIDAACTGFLYLAALQGVTGSDPDHAGETQGAMQRLREVCANPICLGFGLRSVDDVARAFASGARIAVVGSELARTIGEASASGRDPRDAVAARCRALAVALTAS
ncbi:MAG: tryptophan synthase subunit alpha [Planctomycetes bacterium]|nr:tryptophan synthase subunit alpha [Planctomycetota bacterium]